MYMKCWRLQVICYPVKYGLERTKTIDLTVSGLFFIYIVISCIIRHNFIPL